MKADERDLITRVRRSEARSQVFERLRRAVASPQRGGVESREAVADLIRSVDTSGVLDAGEIDEFAGSILFGPGLRDSARRHLIERFKFEQDGEAACLAVLRAAQLCEADTISVRKLLKTEEDIQRKRALLNSRQRDEAKALQSRIGGQKQAFGNASAVDDDVKLATEILKGYRQAKPGIRSVQRIFISCVSAQFRDCRDTLASDLRAMGNTVYVQEDFQQGAGKLVETLQEYIARCDRFISIIGDVYGDAPSLQALSPGSPVRSYAQWEYFFALGERLGGKRVPAKDIHIYIASEQCLAERRVMQPPEHRDLQASFLQLLKNAGQDRRTFDNVDHLCRLVLRDGWNIEPRPRAL